MTLKKLVAKFKKEKPETIEDVLFYTGTTAKFLGAGAFRTAYLLDGKYVVKLPNDASCLDHALREIESLRETRFKRFDSIRKHLPEVYYTDKINGVVLMKFYKPVTKRFYNEIDRLAGEFGDLFCNDEWDYHKENFGLAGERLVVLDLGCLSEYV